MLEMVKPHLPPLLLDLASHSKSNTLSTILCWLLGIGKGYGHLTITVEIIMCAAAQVIQVAK